MKTKTLKQLYAILAVSASIIWGLFIAALIAFLLSSCNPIDEDYIDPTLQPYYNAFMQEAKERGITIKNKSTVMTWGDVKKGHAEWGKSWAKIQINPRYKGNYNLETEAVVFHELGHGLLERGHIEDCNVISLMAVPCYRESYYNESMKEVYLKELFE